MRGPFRASAVARQLVLLTLLGSLACETSSGQDLSGLSAPIRTASANSRPSAISAPPQRHPQSAHVEEPLDDVAPTPPPEPGLSFLGDAQRAQLNAGSEDPPIEVETHYIQSNETRHDLFFPYIAGIGGAYMGVGSDQNYTMAAKAQAEVMFLMDIDTRVVDLHRMYAVFIPAAESPDALLRRWDAEHRAENEAELEKGLGDLAPLHRQRILRGYRNGRETVFRHLQRVIGRKHNSAASSWLSDPELYAHIRLLYRTGRVRIMVGNLAGEASVGTVAAASRTLGLPVRVVYFSNAEEYFKYGKAFIRSIQALDGDERSMVLRTIYSKDWEHADLWAYQVQPLRDFQTRLSDGRNRSRNPMLRYANLEGALDLKPDHEGLTTIGFSSPAPAPASTSAGTGD